MNKTNNYILSGIPTPKVKTLDNWFSRLPRKKKFTVADMLKKYPAMRISNASNILRILHAAGYIDYVCDKVAPHSGRRLFIYARKGNA